MSKYLPKPMSIRQEEHIIKFLIVALNLNLISEVAFADTSRYFDDLEFSYWVDPRDC